MPPEKQPLAVALHRRLALGSDSAQIGDVVLRTWHEVDAALRPIIGQRGVAALYKRALYLTAPAHPSVGALHRSVSSAPDFVPLQQALAQQSKEEAGAAAGALMQTFHDLLASMVGTSLTERLLHSVWANLLSGPLSQDIPS